MLFWDVVHGRMDFGQGPFGALVSDLIATPEVQRLRHMRLMNFDVPFIQDLASARRLAHSVGTCFLAHQLAMNSAVDSPTAKSLVAAALIHDIGIAPFGHLIEHFIRNRYPDFDHARLVAGMVHGTYHPTNNYHQLLPGKTLRVPSVLERHGINIETVVELVSPTAQPSAISADLDIDNIDNIHRMAVFLGDEGARANLRLMLSDARFDNHARLVLSGSAIERVRNWLEMRTRLYTLIIAHPSCVAYNAFLRGLAELAVEHGLIGPANWFMSDADLEQQLLTSKSTALLARQLLSGCEYALIDYVWFLWTAEGATTDTRALEDGVRNVLGTPPLGRSSYFLWPEYKLLSRSVSVETSAGAIRVGSDSRSLLVALVSTSGASQTKHASRDFRSSWRRSLVEVVNTLAAEPPDRVQVPEDMSGFSPFLGTWRGQNALF